MEKQETYDVYILIGAVTLGIALVILILSNGPQATTGNEGVGLSISPSPLPNPTIPNYRTSLIKINKLPSSVYENLPPMPMDFIAVRNKFEQGQLPIYRVTEKYYLQPEFYPNWEANQQRYLMPREIGYSIAGYGAYPSEYIALTKSSDEFEILVFAISDVVSEYWLGAKLEPKFLSYVELKSNYFQDNTKSITQNVSYVKDHIKIVLVSPEEFILEPARNWQIYEWNSQGEIITTKDITPRFEKNWVKQIKIKFKTHNLKAGKYAVVFDFVSPSSDFSYTQTAKYLTRYKAIGNDLTSGWQFGVFFEVV